MSEVLKALLKSGFQLRSQPPEINFQKVSGFRFCVALTHDACSNRHLQMEANLYRFFGSVLVLSQDEWRKANLSRVEGSPDIQQLREIAMRAQISVAAERGMRSVISRPICEQLIPRSFVPYALKGSGGDSSGDQQAG